MKQDLLNEKEIKIYKSYSFTERLGRNFVGHCETVGVRFVFPFIFALALPLMGLVAVQEGYPEWVLGLHLVLSAIVGTGAVISCLLLWTYEPHRLKAREHFKKCLLDK